MWIPVSLFPQPLLALPSGLMNKVAMAAGMEDIHGLRNMDFPSPRPTGYGRAECPIYQQQEKLTQSLQYGPILQVDQTAVRWQIDYIGLFPSSKGQCSILTGIDTYSGYGYAFPLRHISAKTTIHGLTDHPWMYRMPYSQS